MTLAVKTIQEARFVRHKLLSDPLFFTRCYFKEVLNQKFLVNDHHHKLSEILKAIYSGEITRLIINMPPRYTKTEMMVKTLISQGFAINPESTFIHISYSDSLALDNSSAIRDIIKSEWYQFYFPMSIRQDTDSKKRWNNEFGGGLYATASGGQITGFGAGSLEDDDNTFEEIIDRLERQKKFSGGIIIDDPLKVDDARSQVRREIVNERFDTTIRSRVNSRKTFIGIIMQRLHANDLSGYLLSKEPEKWYHVSMPALQYSNSDNTYSSLWPLKQTVEELLSLQRVNRYVFMTQYQQQTENIKLGGEFYSSFDPEFHVKKLSFDPSRTVHITVDNNVFPYIAIGIWQIDDQRPNEGFCYINQVHEIPASDPNNTATRSAQLVNRYLKARNYEDVVYIYGDQTTTAQNTIDDDKKSFFDKFTQEIDKEFVIVKRMPSTNPPVAISGEFVDSIYADNFEDLCIFISETCQTSIKDYQEAKKDAEGKILKKKITEKATGISYEPVGHYSDNKRYFICMAFQTEFSNFKRRIINMKTSQGGQLTDRKF